MTERFVRFDVHVPAFVHLAEQVQRAVPAQVVPVFTPEGEDRRVVEIVAIICSAAENEALTCDFG